MKKSILSLILLASVMVLNAQTNPGTKPPAVPANPLKTTTDSISYVLGEVAANKLIENGMGDMRATNASLLLRGMNDVLDKKKPLLSDSMANIVLNNYYMKLQAERSKIHIEAGNKFLAQNKTKPGVRTTASGLQYEVITEGTGIKPTIVDTFVAHYRGTLLDGTQFDASYDRGEPLTYPVNRVVQGWIEGLQLMSVGSKYKFYIPYNLGYGLMGNGKIPGGALLVFELELLDIKKPAGQ